MRKFPFSKEAIERLIREKGYDDVIKLKDNYVGRGHDKHCVGFIAPEVRCVVQFLLELAGETEAEGVELEDLIIAAGTYCVDNMGFDAIVYFPTYYEFAEAETDIKPVTRPSRTIINSNTGTVNGSLFQVANVEGVVKDHR